MIREWVQNAIRESEPFHSVIQQIDAQKTVQVRGLAGSSFSAFCAALAQRDGRVIAVFGHDGDAKEFFDDMNAWYPDLPVVYYPALEHGIWSDIGPAVTDIGRRLESVQKLLSDEKVVVVLSAAALTEKVAAPQTIKQSRLTVQREDELPFSDFIEHLVRNGYVRSDRVDRPGELAVHGGIIDVYLFDESNPLRIEFFGDQIESIRYFDVESQRSIDRIESFAIVPASSAGPYCPLDEAGLDDLPWTHTVLDFLHPNDSLIIKNETILSERLDSALDDARERMQVYVQDHHATDLEFDEFFVDAAMILNYLEKHPHVNVDELSAGAADVFFDIQPNAHFGGNLDLFRKQIQDIRVTHPNQPVTIALLCDSDEQSNRLAELFQQEQIPESVRVETLNVVQGFSWPRRGLYLFTNRELYSKIRMPKLDRLQRRSATVKEQLEIHPGDYVVHADHGIGVFKGLEMVRAYGKERECLALEYDGGDKLYVPLEKMNQVEKYSSKEGAVPQLNKLGTQTWEKLKARTKKRMKEIAEQLIKLYATRKARPGYSYSTDTVWQKELEASFQYDETPDQLRAISDVKIDMEAPRPMDRLVCGDVGYGKTEVAIRAAFKAINDSKQVAILVPTTILAQQHYVTFRERLKSYPVKIGLLNRFRTPKEQKQILEKLKAGDLDLVVGTHRVLSTDVQFKDLGLLIVDEEQRFGVVHKEKLKLLKNSVDTITLSATPIPRTMHMAMMGAKDMSIINTPPHNRLPVKTEVSRFDRSLIRDAILKEIDRGGQVFFVHNRVQSIYGIHKLVQEIVPEVKMAVAHGQMKGHELEKVMLKFLDGDVKVLISTMIIESGIDMPRANTLIVNRADRLGLGQLYQLRGRVGRSDKQAFAYLLIPPIKRLTQDAIKRLQTIQEYSQLGSGYKIAMRDLEIRGAGNVFGAEQTGFVNALGYEMYMKIIRQSIKEIRQDLELDTPAEVEEEELEFDSKVEVAVDAYLPEMYINTPTDRVHLYKRLVEARSMQKVAELQKEIIDRFGEPPPPTRNLFDYIEIKQHARRIQLDRLIIQEGQLEGIFHASNIPQGEAFRPWLAQIVQHAPDDFEIKPEGDWFRFQMSLLKKDSYLVAAKKFLEKIQ